MDFHWPTAAITAGVMIVIIVMCSVLYYMLTHFTTAQGWFSSDDNAEYKMQMDIQNSDESHVIARKAADREKYELHTKFINDYHRDPTSEEMDNIDNDATFKWRQTLLYEFARRGITVDSSDGV
tara:strand:- start:112 stop:483 length:372 start_codon:yes stop_codon:yes gene_type:complete